ncbi:MAG TPA: RebB like protein, partial [Thalassospira lucentensis]
MNDIVNPQVTDAVTQTNVKVLGESPAQAVSMALQSHSHATGLAMENATLV